MAKKSTRRFSNPKWCICTEGKTEEIYLKAYCEDIGIKDLVDINSECPNCIAQSKNACGRQHRSLIEQIQRCNKSSKYERMIAVHDFDDDGDKKTIESFDDALEIGRQTDISVYYSIPCFEYWLLLHNNPLYADLTRDVCSNKVKNYINSKRKEKGEAPLHKGKYKTLSDLYRYFGGKDGVKTATHNAMKMFPNNEPPAKPSTIRPSTNFYLLLDELRAFADKHKRG